MNQLLQMLQQEAAEWTLRNFPGQKPYQPLFGVVEEVGELAEALGGNAQEAIFDAVADLYVFGANYCTHMGWNLAEVEADSSTGNPVDQPILLTVFVGRLCHAHLKTEQGIRGSAEGHAAKGRVALHDLLYLAKRLACLATGVTEGELMQHVWGVWKNEVQPRVWTQPAPAALTAPSE